MRNSFVTGPLRGWFSTISPSARGIRLDEKKELRHMRAKPFLRGVLLDEVRDPIKTTNIKRLDPISCLSH
ncbi:hypothetical protein Agabi119p4_6835 [Agaricus bisporus var. burnettii]|uniref:Uncharacterized protein n=1 Tax=Agaricus bisporus var. burnettii TaxID=192524 RepID=A0A8H7F095_AGABI|nr:hypothetical protein Agabi119p4_6835 [Agaricus bisporus var. burnettii]